MAAATECIQPTHISRCLLCARHCAVHSEAVLWDKRGEGGILDHI